MKNIKRELSTFWVESNEEKIKSTLKILDCGFFMVVGRRNPPYYYSSFIRIYSPSGEYIFTLPYVAGIKSKEELKRDLILEDLLLDEGWKEIEERLIGYVYDREPEDTSRAYTGGDYYSGWIITYNPAIGYIVKYNPLLFSIYEDQGWEEPIVYRIWADVVSALDNEELVWDYDPDLLPESDPTARPQ